MDPRTNINFRSILTNKYVQIGSIIFIVVNIFLLNLFVFILSKQTSTITNASIQPSTSMTPVNNQSSSTATQQATCASCEAQIELALTQIKNIQTALSATPRPTKSFDTPVNTPIPTTAPATTTAPTSTPTPTRSLTGTPTPTTTVNGVKEYYLLLGSGNSSSSSWTDVSGLQLSINTTLYPTIKTATFEVGGHTPTGNETIWVRLYNASDNTPVANSEITWEGGGNKYIISNPITLASGNKTYKVQMKTQLSYISYIDSAKIHLILY